MVIYSVVMVVLLYVTEILLPVNLNINENISLGLFIVILMIFFKVSKDKWWIKIISTVIGVAVFMVLFVLLSN